jgi:hypothetical protein
MVNIALLADELFAPQDGVSLLLLPVSLRRPKIVRIFLFSANLSVINK